LVRNREQSSAHFPDREPSRLKVETLPDLHYVSAMDPFTGSAFGRWVRQRLGDRSLTQRQFAAMVGLTHGSISKILQGTYAVPPPLGLELAKWAEILQIPDGDIKKFHLYAACAHLPASVRVEFENIIDQHIELRNDYIRLQSELRRSTRVADGE
jgi:transcriptional regulator with XRE-family HTH domain